MGLNTTTSMFETTTLEREYQITAFEIHVDKTAVDNMRYWGVSY
jgi:hypothetical protein